MGFAIIVIGFCVIIGIIIGIFKNGKKGAEDYGKIGFGFGWMLLKLFQLASPIILIIFVMYLIVKGCSN